MPTDTMARSSLLERVIATLDVFPLSQATVIKNVMSMTASMDTAADQLAKALSVDQALTGKVIRLSNSPFYGRVRTVASLNEAITILGFQTIRSLVVATSTSSMFRKGADKVLEQKLWRHSLAVAIGARIIAQKHDRDLAEEAFLVGLVHDIAQLVLLQRFPKEYKPVMERAATSGEIFFECEQEMLGFTHMQLGARILEHWNFPSHLIAAVGQHHDPGDSTPSQDGPVAVRNQTLLHVLFFAGCLAHLNGFSLSVETGSTESELAVSSSGRFLDLDEDAIVLLGEQLQERYTETEESLAG